MAVELASAFVQIIPSARGIESKIAAELAPVEAAAATSGDKAGKSMGSRFASAFKSGGAALVIAGIGIAAVASAVTVENAQNTIARSTGATGKALDGLKTSFENVAKKSPASFGDIAKALAEVNQRTGLTGTGLETLTRQVVTFNRISKDGPVNVNDLTKALSGFGVPAAKMSKAFDEIFRTSQKTGVPIADLVGTLNRAGPIVRQFGIPIGTATGLLAQLDKAGLEAGPTIAGLRGAFLKFAKAGLEPKAALEKSLTAIQDMIAAGNIAGANNLAVQLFGGRGVGLVDAAKSGKLALSDLSKSFDTVGPGILETAKNTSTLSGKFGILKNNAQLALAKLGEPILDVLNQGLKAVLPSLQRVTDGIAAIADHPNAVKVIVALGAAMLTLKAISLGVAAAQKVAKVAQAAWTVATKAAAIATKAFAVAQAILNAVLDANPIVLLVVALVAVGAAFVLAFQHVKPFHDAVVAVATFIQRNWILLGAILLAPFLPFIALVAVIVRNWSTIVDFFRGLVDKIVGFFTEGFGARLVTFLVNTFENVKQIFQGALDVILGIVDLFRSIFSGHWEQAWQDILRIFSGVWAIITGVAAQVLNQLSAILSAGLAIAVGIVRGAVDGIVGFFTALPGRILGFVQTVASAAEAIGVAILHGIVKGVEGAVSAVADIGKAVARAMVKFINEHIIDTINDAIPDELSLFGFHQSLPHNPLPHVPSFDAGGTVPGPKGTPQLALVHGQETIRNTDQEDALLAEVQRLGALLRAGGDTVVVQPFDNAAIERFLDRRDRRKQYLAQPVGA
jgi:hypothetical protein